MKLNILYDGMTEEEIKKHLFNAFLEWMNGKDKFVCSDGKDRYPVRDVGEFLLKGMKGKDK